MSITHAYSNVEKDVLLRVKSPCHHRPLRLVAHAYVWHERYERTCRACGFGWTVERRQIKSEGNMRLDKLEWAASSRIGVPS